MLWQILLLVVGYLVGTISPAYIFGKIFLKKDIRTVGSKNAGATNVFHSIGKKAGVATCLIDMGKGVAVLLLGQYLASVFGFNIIWAFIAAGMVIVGHIWPFYLDFKGGKGAATGYGLMIFIVIWLITHYGMHYLIFTIYAIVALILFLLFRRPRLISYFLLPVLVLLTLIAVPMNPWVIFLIVLIAYLFIIARLTRHLPLAFKDKGRKKK